MENPIEYINKQMREQMVAVAQGMQSDPARVPFFKVEAFLNLNKTNEIIPEKRLYDTLTGIIVQSINPLSILNAGWLESAVEAYRKIIPLLKDKEVITLANYCLSSTQSNLASLEKIAMAKRLNKIFNL